MNKKDKVGCMTVIVALILALLMPIIRFGLGYLGGMILNWFVGRQLIDGLNLIFNTSRFSRELIPLTCATFAIIGKYFRSTNDSTLN